MSDYLRKRHLQQILYPNSLQPFMLKLETYLDIHLYSLNQPKILSKLSGYCQQCGFWPTIPNSYISFHMYFVCKLYNLTLPPPKAL